MLSHLIPVSAQSAAKSCSAPVLRNGYFVPKHELYDHDTRIAYSCDLGYKPAVDGWWTTSTCQNGTWNHKPQCIGKCCIAYLLVWLNAKIQFLQT